MLTSSTITMAIFVVGIVMILFSFIKQSLVMTVMGGIVAFIGAFYVFNLYQYPAFKTLKLVFDTAIGPFVQ